MFIELIKEITPVSTILGLLLIIIFCTADFRKKVRKSKSPWRYYIPMLLFLAVNIVIYLTLTTAALLQSPMKIFFGVMQITDINIINALLPLVIAIIYFGAGAGSFRLFNKEIQFYNRLIDILQNVFNTQLIRTEDIKYGLSESQALYEKLRERVEGLQISASANKWDMLQVKWNEYVEDEEQLNIQVTYLSNLNDRLETVQSKLDVDSVNYKEIKEVTDNIIKRIDTIRKTLIKKLQKYLVAFAFANFKDDDILSKFLIDIEVLSPERGPGPPPNQTLARSLVMGFVFGLFFGPIFGIMKDKEVVLYLWLGAFSLMIFAGFISKAVATVNFIKSMILGAIGGYIVHLVWILILAIDRIETGYSAPGKWLNVNWGIDLFKAPYIGLCFGIVTSLLLFTFKYKIPRKLTTSYRGYMMIALAGFVFYPITYILTNINKDLDFETGLICAFIGVIVMMAMALATHIFRTVR